MRNFLWILILLTACTQVQFAEPQPSKGKGLNYMFKEYMGTYQADLLQLKIEKDAISVFNQKFTLVKDDPLYDEVVVKYVAGSYVASIRQGEYFSVFQLKFYDDKLAIFMLNPDPLSVGRLKQICNVETIENSDSCKIHLIKPEKNEFSELLLSGNMDVICVLKKIEE